MNMIPVIVLVFACIQLTVSEEYAIPPNIDLDDILANDRLLKNYTKEGAHLKESSLKNLFRKLFKLNVQNVMKHTDKVLER
ncbi:OS-D domain containing protein [Asbolus verrucosus]|uniref:OS-D domain containing protein n=1 Tax=Asbolus verrucosus TaxID=1661398 RepID=A0A482W5A6_ASBVE|nr:OS-D domain containing protein [Asbolus verrucosus]